jgi:peroxiredoxin
MVVPVSRTSRRRRRAAVLAAAAVAGAALLSACSNSTGGTGDTGYVPAESTGITAIAASARVAAPQLSGTTLDGKQLSLSDYRGKVVVVNVWGSWCTPCRVEAPALEETFQKYQAKGVQFLGINTRDDNAAAQAFVGSDGLTYPSLQDPDETLLLQFKTMVPPTAIPSSIIIDRSGKVAAKIIGGVTEPQLTQALNTVLAEG